MYSDGELTVGELQRIIRNNPPDLQEILSEAVYHPQHDVRVLAALKLAELFQDVEAIPILAEAMSDPAWKIRKAAARALWEIGDADAASMIRALHFETGTVRDAIVDAMELAGWIPDDVETEVAYRIATWNWQAIIAIGGKAVPGLVSVLSDPDGTVRRGAAWTLGQIGDERAIPFLIGLLADASGGLMGIGERVCDIAAEALERIGTLAALEAVRTWKADQD